MGRGSNPLPFFFAPIKPQELFELVFKVGTAEAMPKAFLNRLMLHYYSCRVNDVCDYPIDFFIGGVCGIAIPCMVGMVPAGAIRCMVAIPCMVGTLPVWVALPYRVWLAWGMLPAGTVPIGGSIEIWIIRIKCGFYGGGVLPNFFQNFT
jgi:hypothetical protein